MPYRLRQHETIPAGISRIVCEQLDMALTGFSHPEHDRHACIHATRKALKKTRAILRLVRTELGKVYTNENSRLRDAGRQRAELRDATARIETLDKMHKLVGDPLEPERFAELRATLVRQREMLAETGDHDLAVFRTTLLEEGRSIGSHRNITGADRPAPAGTTRRGGNPGAAHLCRATRQRVCYADAAVL